VLGRRIAGPAIFEFEELTEPPLPGTQHIIPLESSEQLEEEGEAENGLVDEWIHG
jgi:hypothetical protein